MDPIIRIETSPITIPIDVNSGTCSVTAGTPITFTIVSGISAGIYVTYEWYVNDILVNVGSGYTLTNPQQDDNVYVKVLNCVGNGWIEDIFFYYNDIIDGVPQTYWIDLAASFDYRVISAIMRCGSDMYDVEIQINGTPIVWTGSATSIDVSSVITETIAINLNDVLAGDAITLVTSGNILDDATVLQGKLRIVRVPGLTTTTTTPAPTTTTTTTAATTTTTTTAATTTTTTTAATTTTTTEATTTTTTTEATTTTTTTEPPITTTTTTEPPITTTTSTTSAGTNYIIKYYDCPCGASTGSAQVWSSDPMLSLDYYNTTSGIIHVDSQSGDGSGGEIPSILAGPSAICDDFCPHLITTTTTTATPTPTTTTSSTTTPP